MKKIEITCDACNKNLSERIGYLDYYISVQAATRQTTSTFFRHGNESPEIENPLDFCNLKCMKEWLAKQEQK